MPKQRIVHSAEEITSKELDTGLFIKPRLASTLFHLPLNNLYKHMRRGTLRPYRFATTLLVNRREIESLLKAGVLKAQPSSSLSSSDSSS